MHSLEPIIVERRSDKLTVVEVVDNTKIKAREVATLAAKNLTFPEYTPDNASAILIFHTESGDFLLGGVRSNPGLKDKLTKHGTSYPQQINATIGGYLPDADLVLRSAVMNSIANKMFLNSLPESASEAKKILDHLYNTIGNDEGWEQKVCVHTDKWMEESGEKTMSVLTTIKHISCKDEDIAKINEALKLVMSIKKEEGVALRALSEFKFIELQPIISNSLESHLDDEEVKASKAFDTFGEKVAVTFNDLAVATLSKNFAFKHHTFAQLAL